MDKLFEECVEYFSQEGFLRALQLIYQKYRSIGRFSGKVILKNPTQSEREILSRYLRRVLKQDDIVIDVKEFVFDKFCDTKFSELDFKDVLAAVIGTEVLTKKEENEIEKQKVDNLFKELDEYFSHSEKGLEMVRLIKMNFKTIEGFYKRYSQKEFFNLLKIVITAILNRPQEKVSLPIFATNITNDPHFFDDDKDAGKLFLRVLSNLAGRDFPQNAEEKAELLFENNILIDELSNWCLIYNIGGYLDDNQKDTALFEFSQHKKPIILPLYSIKDYKGFFPYGRFVVIVENPAVFSALLQSVEDVSLVCTNGHMRLSTRIILEGLVKTHSKLYYTGDFDPEGILIADRVISLFGAEPLCMGLEDYMLSLSSKVIDKRRLEMLKNIKSQDLQDVCQKMKELKLAGYQERIVDRIIKRVKEVN